jgi:hypothetical protein
MPLRPEGDGRTPVVRSEERDLGNDQKQKLSVHLEIPGPGRPAIAKVLVTIKGADGKTVKEEELSVGIAPDTALQLWHDAKLQKQAEKEALNQVFKGLSTPASGPGEELLTVNGEQHLMRKNKQVELWLGNNGQLYEP